MRLDAVLSLDRLTSVRGGAEVLPDWMVDNGWRTAHIDDITRGERAEAALRKQAPEVERLKQVARNRLYIGGAGGVLLTLAAQALLGRGSK
jgi:hypothetical protein